jgi:hypothetical protein
MSPTKISLEVREFVLRYVESVEHLEVLLLLHRSPQAAWTAERVSAELRTSPVSTAQRLALLRSQGLLEQARENSSAYRFHSGSANAAVVAQLAEAYKERRHAIIDLIFSKPLEKVRVFAEAFRIRKDKNDG